MRAFTWTKGGRTAWWAGVILALCAGCSEQPAPTAASPLKGALTETQEVQGVAPASAPVLQARAAFDVEPESSCRRTRATVEVTEQIARRGPATVNIVYSLLGTCGGQQGLYYYDFATDGAVAVDPASVSIDPSLRSASVDATVPVFEAEAGIHSQVRVRATWKQTTQGAPKSVTAELEVSAPWISPLYITSPLLSVTAELRRLP